MSSVRSESTSTEMKAKHGNANNINENKSFIRLGQESAKK
jgi:hypothetical protein